MVTEQSVYFKGKGNRTQDDVVTRRQRQTALIKNGAIIAHRFDADSRNGTTLGRDVVQEHGETYEVRERERKKELERKRVREYKPGRDAELELEFLSNSSPACGQTNTCISYNCWGRT